MPFVLFEKKIKKQSRYESVTWTISVTSQEHVAHKIGKIVQYFDCNFWFSHEWKTVIIFHEIWPYDVEVTAKICLPCEQ